MDKWTPLAPSKRASGQYARADLLPSGPERSKGASRLRSSSGATVEERIPLPPSDPFPPVGIIPRFVALHILSFLPLADQVNCARAGRSLAAAVADERNWSRRLEVLDWCTVDGLRIDMDEQGITEPERTIGRRRKTKPKEKEAKAETSKAVHDKTASRDLKKVSTISEDDDFGDFAGPGMATKDSFPDFAFDKGPVGGSFASGTASVALGRGQALQNDGLFSSQTLSPSKSKSKPPPAGSSFFSFSAETKLPLSTSSPSFKRLRAYAIALRPYLKSLRDTSGPSTSSLLFTCDLGLSAQAALLSNLLRFISTSVGGCRRLVETEGRLLDEDETSLSYRSQEAAQHLSQTLLSSFEGTLARRSDAVRAAAHGADTSRAVRRAEEDMRTHANGVWELGNARLALALSERDDYADDKEDLFGRMKAARAFLDRREIFTSGLRGHNPLDNVV
jgi:hypothetical protein